MASRNQKNPRCRRAFIGTLTYKNLSNFGDKGQGLTFQRVNDAALSSLPALLRRWLPDGKQRGHEYVALNPLRNDSKHGSFSVNIRTGRWADFATGDKGGDIISLTAYLFRLSQVEAKNKIAKMLGM